jgi:hypothetical protein
MLFEILIVFLIIIFSYIFKVSDKVGMDKQLTFICLCFIVIITYKMLMYHRMKNNIVKSKSNEGFFDFSKEVNEFISADVPNNATNKTVQQYKEDLTKLQEQVSVMNEYLSEISSIAKGENNPASPLDEMNIQASQQIQDYRIKKLNDDIAQTTDLIKKAKLRDDAKSFKKIPVYSSCVVSNADGSYSTDTPVSPGSTSSSGAVNSGLESAINNAVSGGSASAASGGSVSSTGTTSGAPGQGQANSGIQDLLSRIQNNGLEINLNARD